jgi:phosphoglycolate phosphatase
VHDLYVFDLDGTLVDSLPDITTALNAALLASGHAARALHEVRGFLGDGARELVRRAVGEGPSEAALDDLVASYRARYGQALVRETRLYAGLEALLPTLPACAVLTNKPGREARAIVDALGLAARFVEVVGEGDGHPRKPDPAALLAIIARANAKRPLYVGDSHVDAETAERAGVDFAFVEWGYGAAPAGVRRVRRAEELVRA